jgi:hypothetical protein
LSITGAEGFDGLEVRIDEPDADSRVADPVNWRVLKLLLDRRETAG